MCRCTQLIVLSEVSLTCALNEVAHDTCVCIILSICVGWQASSYTRAFCVDVNQHAKQSMQVTVHVAIAMIGATGDGTVSTEATNY